MFDLRLEVIPAILSKTSQDLMSKINAVLPYVNFIQLDIMDGIFVPNKTVGLDDLKNIPKAKYEFHWMVKDPINWLIHFPGDHLHLIHVETIDSSSFEKILSQIKKQGGRLGLAINPETPLTNLLPYLNNSKKLSEVRDVLIMTVHPGFSGQKYIFEMESKLKTLRSLYPNINIEVDGGVNLETIHHAYKSGANYLAAASAIFNEKNISEAIEKLKKKAVSG